MSEGRGCGSQPPIVKLSMCWSEVTVTVEVGRKDGKVTPKTVGRIGMEEVGDEVKGRSEESRTSTRQCVCASLGVRKWKSGLQSGQANE